MPSGVGASDSFAENKNADVKGSSRVSHRLLFPIVARSPTKACAWRLGALARARHVYGPMRLEVFDPQGKLVESLSPSKRRGFNRGDGAQEPAVMHGRTIW